MQGPEKSDTTLIFQDLRGTETGSGREWFMADRDPRPLSFD